MRKLERAKIALHPDWLEDHVQLQQMLYGSRVAITSTGQRNQPISAAVCVLLVAKESAQSVSAPDCDVGLCVAPCFEEYHTKVYL